MKKNKNYDILDVIICSIFFFALFTINIIIIKYATVMQERDCIDYYINTGYVLEECKNYENLKGN